MLFKLSRRATVSGPRGSGAARSWNITRPNTVELWSLMLERGGITTESAQRTLGYDSGSGNFRQTLKRARADLAECVGTGPEAVIVADADGDLRFGRGIEIFGVVDLEFAGSLRRSRPGHG